MSEQKNLIITFVLSALILFGFNYYFGPSQQTNVADQKIENQSASSNLEDQGSLMLPDEPKVEPLDYSQRIKIESDVVKGSFRLVGCIFDQLSLKKYKETVEKNSSDVKLLSMIDEDSAYYVSPSWKDSKGNAGSLPDENTPWRLADEFINVLTPETPVTLVWFNDNGLKFERTLSLDQNYLITISDKVSNHGHQHVSLVKHVTINRTLDKDVDSNFVLHEGPIAYFNTKLHEPDYSDFDKEPKTFKTNGGWTGFTDKFWLVSLLPEQKSAVTVTFDKKNNVYRNKVDYQPIQLAPNDEKTISTRLFAGAKELRLLDDYEAILDVPHFDLAVDFGWLYFFTKPLYFVLEYFHRLIGNLGLAIMLITLIFKIVLFPFANKSYKSMARMKGLQPKIEQINKRFANDPAKKSQEVFALYRKEKVNPVGGCLPLLIQAPIFFCLYKVLFVSIEMRHAPFFGWIKDLSVPDPTSFVNLFGLLPFSAPSFLQIGALPIIMGITMFLQQRLNPQPADPIQAKVMLLLPLVFTFVFANFAAGLVVYWICNNILSMAQQWFITRQVPQK